MNEQDRLNRFLSPDPHDAGCDEKMAVPHIYVDLTLERGDAAESCPEWRRTYWRAVHAPRIRRPARGRRQGLRAEPTRSATPASAA